MRLFTCFTVCVRHTMGKIFPTNIYSDLVKIASLPKKDIPCRNWSLPSSSNWKMHPDISLEPREDTLILFAPGPAMGESFRVSKKTLSKSIPFLINFDNMPTVFFNVSGALEFWQVEVEGDGRPHEHMMSQDASNSWTNQWQHQQLCM